MTKTIDFEVTDSNGRTIDRGTAVVDNTDERPIAAIQPHWRVRDEATEIDADNLPVTTLFTDQGDFDVKWWVTSQQDKKG